MASLKIPLEGTTNCSMQHRGCYIVTQQAKCYGIQIICTSCSQLSMLLHDTLCPHKIVPFNSALHKVHLWVCM